MTSLAGYPHIPSALERKHPPILSEYLRSKLGLDALHEANELVPKALEGFNCALKFDHMRLNRIKPDHDQ